MKQLPRLQEKYIKEIRQQLKDELKLDNIMSVPTLSKIVINSGLGEAKFDKSIIDEMVRDMTMIAGQAPVVTKSKKAVSNFKIRENMPIGAMVTLRGDMMWYFIDRLISIVLPRIKDFRGISAKAFDGRGNYSLGMREHTVFPEVDATKVTKIRGLQVVINTTATNDNDGYLLLEKLGMPFQKKK
jgi:large subunit ribosomal protein L5